MQEVRLTEDSRLSESQRNGDCKGGLVKRASLRLPEGLSSLTQTPKYRISLEERTTKPGSSAWGRQGPWTTPSHLTPPGVPRFQRPRKQQLPPCKTLPDVTTMY